MANRQLEKSQWTPVKWQRLSKFKEKTFDFQLSVKTLKLFEFLEQFIVDTFVIKLNQIW